MGNLSRHFNSRDFKCGCGCEWEGVSPRLVEALEKLILRLGGCQIQVVSGLRCDYQNTRVGGGPASMHLKGQAADVVVPLVDPARLFIEALLVPEFGGVGYYPESGRIHLDVRPGRVIWLEHDGRTRYFRMGQGSYTPAVHP